MKIFNKKILGLIISIFFIVLIIQQVDIKKSFESIHHINLTYFPLIIPLYLLSFMFRAYRWRFILSSDSLLKIRSLISSLFIGFMVNCFLPARMGEFYRAHLFGKKENIKRATVFASIVLERILDGSVLFLILLSFVCFTYHKPWLFKLCFAAGFIFIGGFIFLLLFAKFRKLANFQSGLLYFKNLLNKGISIFPDSIQKKVYYLADKAKYLLISFVDGLEVFNHSSLLLKSFILTIFIWLLEGTSMFIVIKGFGIQISYLSSFFVLCVMAFSTMIPAGPASIGPYQWGYMLALGVFNISKDVSFAVSIVNQFIGIFLVTVSGLYFMWKDHINMKELKNEVSLEEGAESAF